jgi:anaerobic ribonucleoside-triphosphate reductase activating protein
MNYATIKPLDVANGEGIRVSLFVSGCTHHCPECFNSEAWDFNYGEPYTEEIEEKVLTLLGKPMIQGLSLLGGEPFEPCNQRVLVGLLRKAKARYPEKTVWCYSGYVYDKELKVPSRARCEVTDEMLSMIDILVDGRFEKDKKNLNLRFRGSTNQRVLDLKECERTGTIVLWQGLATEKL